MAAHANFSSGADNRLPRHQVQDRAIAAMAVDNEDFAKAMMRQAQAYVQEVIDHVRRFDAQCLGKVHVMRGISMHDGRNDDYLVRDLCRVGG